MPYSASDNDQRRLYTDENDTVRILITTYPQFFIHTKTQNGRWRRRALTIHLTGWYPQDIWGLFYSVINETLSQQSAEEVYAFLRAEYNNWFPWLQRYLSSSAYDYLRRDFGPDAPEIDPVRWAALDGSYYMSGTTITAYAECSWNGCTAERDRLAPVSSDYCDEHQARITSGEVSRCSNCYGWDDHTNFISINVYQTGIVTGHEDCLNRHYSICEDSEAADPLAPHWFLHERRTDCLCSNIINGYGYRPEPIFHPELPPSARALYIGMELEAEFGSVSMRQFKSWYRRQIKDFYYIKRDSSITNGYEIVTHPFTPDWGMERDWEEFQELIDLGAHENGSSCGQHIHMSKDAFDSSHLWKVLQMHQRLANFIQTIGGRRDSRWGSFSSNARMRKDIAKIAKEKGRGSYGYERYMAVNLRPEHTIELRYPAGDIRPHAIRKNIQWIWALYHFTDELTPKLINEGAIDKPGMFIYWLEQNKLLLPDLYDWVMNHTLTPIPFEIKPRLRGPREGVLPGGDTRPYMPPPEPPIPPHPNCGPHMTYAPVATQERGNHTYIDENGEEWFICPWNNSYLQHVSSALLASIQQDGGWLAGYTYDYDQGYYRDHRSGVPWIWDLEDDEYDTDSGEYIETYGRSYI